MNQKERCTAYVNDGFCSRDNCQFLHLGANDANEYEFLYIWSFRAPQDEMYHNELKRKRFEFHDGIPYQPPLKKIKVESNNLSPQPPPPIPIQLNFPPSYISMANSIPQLPYTTQSPPNFSTYPTIKEEPFPELSEPTELQKKKLESVQRRDAPILVKSKKNEDDFIDIDMGLSNSFTEEDILKNGYFSKTVSEEDQKLFEKWKHIDFSETHISLEIFPFAKDSNCVVGREIRKNATNLLIDQYFKKFGDSKKSIIYALDAEEKLFSEHRGILSNYKSAMAGLSRRVSSY